MAYANLWTTDHPVAGNNQAKDLDDAIRRARVDIMERILSIVGGSATATDDPINPANATTAALKIAVDTKPTINATDNIIPKRLNSTTLANSGITDDGTTVSTPRAVALSGAVSHSGVGFASSTQPRFRATKSANQSYAPGVTALITFDTEDFDVGAGYGSSSRFTVPTGQGGLYMFAATIQPMTSGSNFSFSGQFTTKFIKNGSTVGPIQVFQDYDESESNNWQASGHMFILLTLAAGDYIEITSTNDDGVSTGNIGSGSEFCGARLW